MAKTLSKMPKLRDDPKRDKDGWKANLKAARKDKGARREFEKGEGR